LIVSGSSFYVWAPIFGNIAGDRAATTIIHRSTALGGCAFCVRNTCIGIGVGVGVGVGVGISPSAIVITAPHGYKHQGYQKRNQTQ
jgi:hypothetical protein